MSRTLVFGLSGQIGEAVLPGLLARGRPVLAVSREARVDQPGLEWTRGSLESLTVAPSDTDLILSLGPLDAFAAWFARVRPTAGRVVAIGSAGRQDKNESADPSERAVARQLEAASGLLFETAGIAGKAITVLEPTLIYGGGRDQSLSRLVAFAQRWRFLPLPRSATGLRQPVHVDDVANAVLQVIDEPATHGGRYALPGGEPLRFDAMVRRTLERHAPGARLLRLPTALFTLGLSASALLGRVPAGTGWLSRLALDQTSDGSEAGKTFGYRPRPFDP